MVGLLGCGCCENNCCPDGNTWTYNYNLSSQLTPWPFEYGDTGDLTSSGLEMRSPAPFTDPDPSIVGSRKSDNVQSVYFPLASPDPPIRHGFGGLDLRKLQHTLTVPTKQEIAGWRPYPDATAQGMQMVLRFGLAVGRRQITRNIVPSWAIGLDYIYTKEVFRRSNGVLVPSYTTEVKGWFGDQGFAFSGGWRALEYQTTRLYGPYSNHEWMRYTEGTPPNSMDIISRINSVFGQSTYDCTAFSFGSATTERSDNLLIDQWTYYARKTINHNKLFYPSPPYDLISCFPYFFVEVTWQPAPGSLGLSYHSFNNTKVVLKQSNWSYGNVGAL
jgi:hypothetical protein